METAQATTTYNKPEPALLWPVVFQALLGTLIIGEQVIKQWRVWGSGWRFMAVAFLFVLLWGPCIELIRRWRGKEVKFSVLAHSGYTLVWLAVVLFRHQ